MELLLIPMSIWDPFIAVGSAIMQLLYWVVSGILVLAYHIFAPVLGADSGWTCAVHHVPHRGHPDCVDPAVRQADQIVTQYAAVAAQGSRTLQKKHGHDREKLGQETMKLYKENNANPLSSCLPLILQIPIFWLCFVCLMAPPAAFLAATGLRSTQIC